MGQTITMGRHWSDLSHFSGQFLFGGVWGLWGWHRLLYPFAIADF